MHARLTARLSVALLMSTAAAGIAHAQAQAPQVQAVQVDASRPDWENPAVFARGKLPAAVTHFPFESRAAAMVGDKTRSARYQSLDGPWSFSFSPSADDVPTGFEKPAYDVSAWKTIKVPAMWQAEGYDQARYNNITYPHPANRPLIPHAANPVGSYRRTVEIPANWSGQDLILHIGAAGSAYRVWVNGAEVGYSEDSKLPSEFDVTALLKPGQKNVVAIQIHRWSDGSYLEDQDFWRVSGIERSVYLKAVPKTRLTDLFVHAGLDKDYRDGLLSTDVTLTERAQRLQLRMTLLDGDKVGRHARPLRSRRGAARTETLAATVAGVRHWTAETPNLYTLLVELIRCGRQADPGHAAAHRLPHGRDQARPGDGQRPAHCHPRRQPSRARSRDLPRHVGSLHAPRHRADEAQQHQRGAHLALPERRALVRAGRRGTACT